MPSRVLAVLWLAMIALFWLAEARSSSSSSGSHGQHRRHRHPSHSAVSSLSDAEFPDFPASAPKDIARGQQGSADYEPEAHRRLLSRRSLLDRLRLKSRETQPLPTFHRRRPSSGGMNDNGDNNGNDRIDDFDYDYDSSSNNNDDGLGDALLELSERELAEALWAHARGKRHNRQRNWTAEDLKLFSDSRLKLAQFAESESDYEVEVHEAQNSSVCNYTVVPIPDPGDRVPRQLEHIKCNHAGSRCQDKGRFCCLQTYRNVEVSYTTTGRTETLKVYSGCVCALQSYGNLEPYAPKVNIDD